MQNKKWGIVVAIILLIIVVVATIALIWQKESQETIQLWDEVTIDYTIALEDGRIFAKNTENITIWSGSIPGIDNYLIGSQSGDTLILTIPASESYGKHYNPTLIQRMPIYTLTQAGITPAEDTFIMLWSKRYYIQNIENDIVTLDENPAHTRQDMSYSITITEREK